MSKKGTLICDKCGREELEYEAKQKLHFGTVQIKVLSGLYGKDERSFDFCPECMRELKFTETTEYTNGNKEETIIKNSSDKLYDAIREMILECQEDV